MAVWFDDLRQACRGRDPVTQPFGRPAA